MGTQFAWVGAPRVKAGLALIALALAVCLLASGPAQAHKLILGVNTDGIGEHPGASLDAFKQRTGRMPQIAMFYRDWNPKWSTALVTPKIVAAIGDRGAVPMITWEPTLAAGVKPRQTQYSLDNIAGGAFDDYIKRAAAEAAAFGKPLMICFGHEMNGSWYTWGVGPLGNTPDDFVRAWRHIVDIFNRAGADNVRWVWAPNVYGHGFVTGFQPFYPGDDYVDIVGLDGYNFGPTTDTPWLGFKQLFHKSYKAAGRLTSKPLIVAETSSTEKGGNKPQWIRKAIGNTLKREMPKVRALIWFNRKKETDWRVNSSQDSLAAFRHQVSKGRLSGNVGSLLDATKRPVVAKRLP